MDTLARKKMGVVTKYAIENFSAGDWLMLGQLTGRLSLVQDHPRLLRALSFGDDDYAYCATEVANQIFESGALDVDEVIDHFDIDLWYEQKHPDKASRLFRRIKGDPPKYWKEGYLKLFVSHLARNRAKVASLKVALEGWGVSSFIAHQDIEPSREWQTEIESALASMDVLVALIEPGFRESAWTDHEVGYALGRGVDVVPLLIGQDPHGFIAKIQGIPIKGKHAPEVAEELALVLFRKPRLRVQLLLGLAKALTTVDGETRVARIRRLDRLITDGQMKDLLERSNLTDDDRQKLDDLSDRVGAFRPAATPDEDDNDIPF